MSVRSSGSAWFPTYSVSSLAQAAAVQNTWYTLLNTTADCYVYSVAIMMSTVQETLEVRYTIDGSVYTIAAGVVCAADTWFVGGVNVSTGLPYFEAAGNRVNWIRYDFCGRSVKVEVRKTTVAGANVLNGYVTFGSMK